MKKDCTKPCFSNGSECGAWMDKNCDNCVKGSRYNATLTDIACRIFGILKRKRREKKSVKVLDEMTLGEIKQLQKDYEKELKEILIHYVETHPHCREIIMKPPHPFQLPLYCDTKHIKDMEYRVGLNTKENF